MTPSHLAPISALILPFGRIVSASVHTSTRQPLEVSTCDVGKGRAAGEQHWTSCGAPRRRHPACSHAVPTARSAARLEPPVARQVLGDHHAQRAAGVVHLRQKWESRQMAAGGGARVGGRRVATTPPPPLAPHLVAGRPASGPTSTGGTDVLMARTPEATARLRRPANDMGLRGSLLGACWSSAALLIGLAGRNVRSGDSLSPIFCSVGGRGAQQEA